MAGPGGLTGYISPPPPGREQDQVLIPQLVAPCPTLPFTNTPPCQNNIRSCFRQILGLCSPCKGVCAVKAERVRRLG